MKIVSTGRTISTSEYLARKQKERRKRWLIASGVLGGLIVATVFVLRLNSLQITSVVAEGVPATGSAQVEARTLELLSGSYLWLVPKTNTFIYPKSRLEKELPRAFPRLSSVALSLDGMHLLKIEAVERTPYALYCHALVPSGVEGCYFLDETGFIFDTSPTFSEGVYFVYRAEPAFQNPLGRQFVPQGEFESLVVFITRLGKAGAEPRSLVLTETEDKLVLASGATILFSRQADTRSLAQALESFLDSDTIKAKPGFWQKLQTLDMRTENKVFYTFRE